jgi:hypothetical protein
MNKNILLATLLSLTAAAVIVLSFRYQLSADSMIGYGSVLALLGMAALEYRLSWKRLVGRS